MALINISRPRSDPFGRPQLDQCTSLRRVKVAREQSVRIGIEPLKKAGHGDGIEEGNRRNAGLTFGISSYPTDMGARVELRSTGSRC